VEDYERIKLIAGSYPEVVKMINKSNESTLLNSPEFLDFQNQIKTTEEALKSIKDSGRKATETQRLRAMKNASTALLKKALTLGVDQWILDGVKTWIDTFLPGIVNLRIYPYIDRPDEHIFGHLKKQCFEDPDSGSFHFTYGSFPTEEITMVGIVTSVPTEGGEQFKPLGEFEKEKLADHESFEHAFRGLFRGFDGLEEMIRTCHFPRILVNPITVYRNVAPTHLPK
jgi:hypothetical protein